MQNSVIKGEIKPILMRVLPLYPNCVKKNCAKNRKMSKKRLTSCFMRYKIGAQMGVVPVVEQNIGKTVVRR